MTEELFMLSGLPPSGTLTPIMSRRIGMRAKDLSLLGFVAEQSGASVSALGDGMRFLNRNLPLAGQGSKAAQDAFSAIGMKEGTPA